ncbi:NTP pyrophosphohydrolase [Herbihabitans rhizosphaerae]|uniref:NTP pyrophosphohydrolase n=1 Tax=Herbihabitans rhizosphaerae TaxID=1872711 RepID=UPI001F5FCC77|nr:NTP pyrophosphohydrolase [Herbihabitans rhizosphaerae]
MTLVIVDAANVVGSVPDGWWRDRAGATARLRDRLPGDLRLPEVPKPWRIVMVVEGAARGVHGSDDVETVAAQGEGDDTIVELVRAAGEPCVVVTADRGLRARVTDLGATVVGPSAARRSTGTH